MLIRMKKSLPIALDGITSRRFEVGDEIDAPEHIAKGLIEQKLAKEIEPVIPELDEEEEKPKKKKSKGPAPENKDEGHFPREDKEEEEDEVEPMKKMRVHELAKHIGVDVEDVLLKATELGYDDITNYRKVVDGERVARIVEAFK